MRREPASEERQALVLVGGEVVPEASAGSGEPATVRLGLATFDAVAVVDHLHHGPEVVVASGPLLDDALALEARLGEGPSMQAVASGDLVVCRDLEHDRRWPRFATAALAGGLPLRRWVAFPLALPGEAALGSIVLAAAAPGIVTAAELAVVGALADRCSLILSTRVAAGREARAVLATDAVRVVGLAVGVLMATEGLSESEALARLRTRSHESGCPLSDTAVAVLTEHRMSFR